MYHVLPWPYKDDVVKHTQMEEEERRLGEAGKELRLISKIHVNYPLMLYFQPHWVILLLIKTTD